MGIIDEQAQIQDYQYILYRVSFYFVTNKMQALARRPQRKEMVSVSV